VLADWKIEQPDAAKVAPPDRHLSKPGFSARYREGPRRSCYLERLRVVAAEPATPIAYAGLIVPAGMTATTTTVTLRGTLLEGHVSL